MFEPLQALRQIIQETDHLTSADEVLTTIVNRVRIALSCDVCSIYLADNSREDWVLVATEGLNPKSVGRVRLGKGQGLTGNIVQHQTLLNLKNAPLHPDYRYFPITGEEHYLGFLGVPVINFRETVGVLVVQHRESRQFSSEEEAFLITVAAQLSSSLKLITERDESSVLTAHKKDNQIKVNGAKGAAGIAMGQALFVEPSRDLSAVEDLPCDDVDAEIEIFNEALKKVKLEVQAGGEKFTSDLDKEVHDLFGVYLMLLNDNEFAEEIEMRIQSGLMAKSALKHTIQARASQFEILEDAYLKARGEDIRHIGTKIFSYLCPHQSEPGPIPENDYIIVCRNFSIADFAQHSLKRLKAIVCKEGSSLSHTAVLANALGITAVMGVGQVKREKVENNIAVVDGYRAQVVFNAGREMQQEYRRLILQQNKLDTSLAKLRDLPAETTDNVRFNLYANTGLLADLSPGIKNGAEGIGLYRSEIPFMMHDSFPSEEEQSQIYRQVLQTYTPKTVYIRTLDIGGDKCPPYYKFQEENPFLGWRGIRFTLDNPNILLTQLRAMLKASVGLDNLKLMLPMVSRIEEIDNFRDALHEALQQLNNEGLNIKEPPIGVMIEVPSALMILKFLAQRIKFISIGTNDLTQYLLAVDRNNPRVSSLFNSLNPAVIHSINSIVQTAHQLRLPVSICGEMAADPMAIPLLIGMGVDTLSMNAHSLPKAKWIIRSMSKAHASKLLSMALSLEYESEIIELMQNELEQSGLGSLVRPGS